MKKVLFFFVVALAFAACTKKPAEQAPAVDSTVVAVDTVAAVDTAAAVADTTATPAN